MSRRLARSTVYVGVVAAVLGLSKVHSAVIADPPYPFTGTSRFAWALAYAAVLGAAAYGVGLPDLPRSTRQALQAAVAASALGATAVSLLQLVAGDALLPRFVVFGAAILLVPWFLGCVALARDGASPSVVRDRVLVVSDTASLAGLRHELANGAERPARVTAVVERAEIEPTGDGHLPLVERARRERASVLVLDRDAQADPQVLVQAEVLHHQGLRVRTVTMLYEDWLGKLPLAELEQASLLFDIREIHHGRYVRLKRLVDVVLGAAGTLVFVLAVPVVLAGNRIANRGPLFYTQPRVGKGGRIFDIVKFRTMVAAGGEGVPTRWTSRGDPRVTPFGHLLRVTHLDELPQVLNILRGELSVVGPRPEQPHYVEELTAKLPFYDLRHLVRPGLTGWAQVKYGYASDDRDALEKLQYEFFYLRHQGIALDLRIVARTVRAVLGREGR